jgi:hypothetical protein
METYWKNCLKQNVKRCGHSLRQNAEELRQRGEPRAADMSVSMSDVCDALLELALANPASEKGCLSAAANVYALLEGNGLGDLLIWPAYRRAEMHRCAEEWTYVTDLIREANQQLQGDKKKKRK